MRRRYTVNTVLIQLVVDSSLVSLALLAASILRPWLQFLPFAAHYPDVIRIHWALYLVFPFEWCLSAMLVKVYETQKDLSLIEELMRLILAIGFGSAIMAGSLFLTFRQISRLLFLTFICMAFLLLMISHIISFYIKKTSQIKCGNQRRVICLGYNEIGCVLRQLIEEHPGWGLNFQGYMIPDGLRGDLSELEIKIFGSIEDLKIILNLSEVDDVIIVASYPPLFKLENLIQALIPIPVKVWLVPEFIQYALFKAVVEEFAGLPLIDLRAPAFNDFQRLTKRAFDLVLCTLILPLALAAMAIISVLILVLDGKPIWIRQDRVGENGRMFGIYKFRSMVVSSSELLNQIDFNDLKGSRIHKMPNDPRVTSFGKLLRRFSLDELPQLFNVLNGEMSLVGPRPELPSIVEKYELWQHQRLMVPPGMTGWWQINGRSNLLMHNNTDLDLYYIKNYSFTLDVFILLRTIFKVISGEGAF